MTTLPLCDATVGFKRRVAPDPAPQIVSKSMRPRRRAAIDSAANAPQAPRRIILGGR
jgi:hypothetical protein